MKRSRPASSSSPAKPPRRKRQTAAQLHALQRWTARAVMRPLTAGGRMRPVWNDGTSTNKFAARFITSGPRLSSFERLEIYNRQYWFRVFDCLADDYPGVRAVLGEVQFRNLAIAYLANHPSRSFTLRNLGRRLPAFIRSQPRWTAPRTKLALAMARLEWSHIEAFDNASMPPLAAADLAGRDAAKIHLRLQPHLTLLRLDWPLDDYLIVLRENSRLRGEASNAIAPSERPRRPRKVPLPKTGAVFLAVHRHRNLVYYKRLEAPQFQLLTALEKGASLERALRASGAAAQERPVREWFQDWAALGWFWVPR